MTPITVLAALCFTSFGTRVDDTVTRSLEADLKLLAGKWVMQHPPTGWDRVVLEFRINGKNVSVARCAQSPSFTTITPFAAARLPERDGRRMVTREWILAEYSRLC